MQFTKAQIITLFLASTQAQVTVDLLINGNSSAATVAAGTPTSALTVASSLTVCTADTSCTGTANEKCGAQRVSTVGGTAGAEDVATKKCVYQRACGNVGKVEGKEFLIECIDTTVRTAEEKTATDPVTMFANVATIVGLDGATSFSAITNVKIPSKDNYQTGWWVASGAGTTQSPYVYTETDKPVNNKCTLNSECAAEECCANWPDTNNKRCTAKTNGGVAQNIKPFDEFTPVCAASGSAPPISAKTDLGKEAQAQAAQAVSDFHALEETTAKTAEKYEELTAEEKAAWDAEWAAKVVARKAFDDADRLATGYEALDNDGKAVYDAELLKWKKAVYEKCEADKLSIDCQEAKQIRTASETYRKTDGYYAKSTEQREAVDQLQLNEDAKTKATLTAAWIATNAPAAGTAGSTCSASAKCSDANMCCGTATPNANAAGVTTGERTGVCASKSSKAYTDGLGVAFKHVCGAEKLVAAVGAMLAASYLM